MTRAFPPELVDQVLLDSGRIEQGGRLLPARVVVYFVLATGLLGGHGHPDTARLLIDGLTREPWWPQGRSLPTGPAIDRARQRLGPEPLRRLFARTRPAPAARSTSAAWFRDLRLVALDGAIFDVPASAPNADFFGHPVGTTARPPSRTTGRTTAVQDQIGFPQARVSALVECGTDTVFTADVGPLPDHESALEAAIYPALTRGTLALADRGTTDPATWHAARAGGADLLWQVPSSLRLPITARLDDGSQLAEPGRERACPAQVRVIDYRLDTDPRHAPPHRLLTSLLDPAAAPAAELAARFVQQSRTDAALDHLTPAQPGPGPVLRSHHPDGIAQEIFALLLLRHAFPPARTTPAVRRHPTIHLIPALH
ncbi:hypothetical protein KCH_66670 [Kitasatospora cheerisanensis KCTC 2395]|uniref:Transposase IS4 N-terminal domain-containing protein n=1 Tax=Kitasatospora cheerisanensis KCTC 2395 TaxID=1348663 RepID=A0A066YUE8_9ACTN|nr:hypothetical protein KCH_66670 [Kitasatospora cheerisanensis KCTC 2395]